MSHSSKLMTLDVVALGLTDLRRQISLGELTVEDYCKLFDVLEDVKRLQDSMSRLRLIVEIDGSQQGDEQLELTLEPTASDGMTKFYRDAISRGDEVQSFEVSFSNSEDLLEVIRLMKRTDPRGAI